MTAADIEEDALLGRSLGSTSGKIGNALSKKVPKQANHVATPASRIEQEAKRNAMSNQPEVSLRQNLHDTGTSKQPTLAGTSKAARQERAKLGEGRSPLTSLPQSRTAKSNTAVSPQHPDTYTKRQSLSPSQSTTTIDNECGGNNQAARSTSEPQISERSGGKTSSKYVDAAWSDAARSNLAQSRTESAASSSATPPTSTTATLAALTTSGTGTAGGSASVAGPATDVGRSSHAVFIPRNGSALPSSAEQVAAVQAAVAALASSAAPFRANSVGGSSGLPVPSSSSSSTSSVSSQHRGSHVQPASFAFRQPLQVHHHQQHHQQQQHLAMERDRFTASLTNCIIAFLSPILPTEEEYRIKEATRRQLERLAGKISPGAKLLAFGSMANGFALKNSDMDLCCLIASKNDHDASMRRSGAGEHTASQLVEMLGKVLREETDFTVMPLPKARIPIIKISRPPTSELPYEIACDIGFENRLALENTRLLLSYAMVDPPRLRTLVLFLKVWTKRRKLNSPYTGTLSSYGYTLMMLFFLMHVKRPAVLPNLQKIVPLTTSGERKQDANINGQNVYFYDDVSTLRKEWSSLNTENVGELLLDFFKYFSKEFGYSRDVISIRTEHGVLAKDPHMWSAELCIEDPFQLGYNVARTVTKDGLYTIRGEFMRASRILTTRMDRVSAALAELCEEREDGLTRAPEPAHHYRGGIRQTAARASGPYPQPALYLASGAFDPRYLRDLTRRLEAGGSIASEFGGSFAFEEMARGLAQAQHNGSAMGYPPTTALLAPLSQNVGLSPRQSVMRAGLRYETPPRRGQYVVPSPTGTKGSLSPVRRGVDDIVSGQTSANPPKEVQGHTAIGNTDTQGMPSRTTQDTSGMPTPRMLSSARSEDGGASYERRKGKRWNGTQPNDDLDPPANHGGIGNASARTSPRMQDAVPQGLLHPSSALNGGAYGIGEAFAYGTEISFGSQRFQLYPQSSTKNRQSSASEAMPLRISTAPEELHIDGGKHQVKRIVSGNTDGAEPNDKVDGLVQQRASRSFSDGTRRRSSLPRPTTNGVHKKEDASSTSAPLMPDMLSLTVQGATALGPGPSCRSSRSSSGDSGSHGHVSAASVSLHGRPSMQEEIFVSSHNGQIAQMSAPTSSATLRVSYSDGAPAQQRVPSQSASGLPYLTPSPWTSPSTPMPLTSTASGALGGGDLRQHGEACSSSDVASSPVPSQSQEGFAHDDDNDDNEPSVSDGTLDDLARISMVDSSIGGEEETAAAAAAAAYETNGGAPLGSGDGDGIDVAAPHNGNVPVASKEHDVRSWAASQHEQLVRQRSTR